MPGLVKATASTLNGCMEGCVAREENWQTLAHFVHFRVFHDKITVFLTQYQCLHLEQVMTSCRFFMLFAKDNQMRDLPFLSARKLFFISVRHSLKL